MAVRIQQTHCHTGLVFASSVLVPCNGVSCARSPCTAPCLGTHCASCWRSSTAMITGLLHDPRTL